MSSMDKDGEHRIISKTEPVSTIYFFKTFFDIINLLCLDGVTPTSNGVDFRQNDFVLGFLFGHFAVCFLQSILL